MKVIFRKDVKNNCIVAFFPEAPAQHGNILCYEHIGQHGEASYKYYSELSKVNPEEYKDLLAELQKIYDNELVVRARLSYSDLTEKAWKRGD